MPFNSQHGLSNSSMLIGGKPIIIAVRALLVLSYLFTTSVYYCTAINH